MECSVLTQPLARPVDAQGGSGLCRAEETPLGQWEDGLFVPLAEDTFYVRT